MNSLTIVEVPKKRESEFTVKKKERANSLQVTSHGLTNFVVLHIMLVTK